MPTFSDLARAAYCPRQLYYARRDDDRGPPPEARERRDLAFRYPDLRAADDATLEALPIDCDPREYRTALDDLAARDDWEALADPPRTMVRLDGRDCRGIAHKVLDGVAGGEPNGEFDAESTDQTGVDRSDEGGSCERMEESERDDVEATPRSPTPVLVSPGAPPERGVWEPQRVRAVAIAKALAWEQRREVPRALVEYPASATVRTVRLTTANRAIYRRTLRAVRSLDGPPPRLRGTSKCDACEYRTRCGVRTRSMRSLLGL